MKKLSMTLWASLTALLLALALGACGGSGDTGADPEEKSPGDVAMLYVDAFRGEDGLIAYNPNSSWDGSYFESLGASAEEVVGEPLTAAQNEQVAAAYKKALGQVEAELVDEQVDGDTATVTLSMRGLGYDKAMKAAARDWVYDQKDPAGSYTTLLLTALDRVTPVEKPVEVKMTLNQGGDGLWAPDSESGAALTQALLQ